MPCKFKNWLLSILYQFTNHFPKCWGYHMHTPPHISFKKLHTCISCSCKVFLEAMNKQFGNSHWNTEKHACARFYEPYRFTQNWTYYCFIDRSVYSNSIYQFHYINSCAATHFLSHIPANFPHKCFLTTYSE
jgi:hypothetical protein